MTEDEARNKWCPMSRTAKEGNRLYSKDEGTYLADTCIGSRCMMWRGEWKDPKFSDGTHGYCGLAGKP